jgi:hypothetical protein
VVRRGIAIVLHAMEDRLGTKGPFRSHGSLMTEQSERKLDHASFSIRGRRSSQDMLWDSRAFGFLRISGERSFTSDLHIWRCYQPGIPGVIPAKRTQRFMEEGIFCHDEVWLILFEALKGTGTLHWKNRVKDFSS